MFDDVHTKKTIQKINRSNALSSHLEFLLYIRYQKKFELLVVDVVGIFFRVIVDVVVAAVVECPSEK